jgi:hypothetical protein
LQLVDFEWCRQHGLEAINTCFNGYTLLSQQISQQKQKRLEIMQQEVIKKLPLLGRQAILEDSNRLEFIEEAVQTVLNTAHQARVENLSQVLVTGLIQESFDRDRNSRILQTVAQLSGSDILLLNSIASQRTFKIETTQEDNFHHLEFLTLIKKDLDCVSSISANQDGKKYTDNINKRDI